MHLVIWLLVAQWGEWYRWVPHLPLSVEDQWI